MLVEPVVMLARASAAAPDVLVSVVAATLAYDLAGGEWEEKKHPLGSVVRRTPGDSVIMATATVST
jgi:hypothetical protein